MPIVYSVIITCNINLISPYYDVWVPTSYLLCSMKKCSSARNFIYIKLLLLDYRVTNEHNYCMAQQDDDTAQDEGIVHTGIPNIKTKYE